ncbi:MAG: quinoprotein relay system zinc metallohydrolase 2, partial [Mangrovicoccus sp.]|nr:quinoprotein relay system zinc metallohydrolase 2 [Mangrovicoccus sp.]
MFEAVALVCALASGAESCRDVLVPGHAGATAEACVASVEAAPPGWLAEVDLRGIDCRPRPGPGLDFSEVAPGLFVHEGQIADAGPGNAGDVANIGFVIGDAAVAVIDSGGSRLVGEQVYLAVRARTAQPVTTLVLTHMHPDHVLCAAAFADVGATIVGHVHLPRALADRQEAYLTAFAGRIGDPGFIGTRIVAPSSLVEDRAEIDLGGRVLELRRWPTGHSESDLTVFDAATGTLFTGDLVFDRYTPSLDGSLRGWQANLAEIRAIPAARAIPGHGGPVLAWPAGAAPEARYLDRLAADATDAIAAGVPLSEAIDTIGQGEAG